MSHSFILIIMIAVAITIALRNSDSNSPATIPKSIEINCFCNKIEHFNFESRGKRNKQSSKKRNILILRAGKKNKQLGF